MCKCIIDVPQKALARLKEMDPEDIIYKGKLGPTGFEVMGSRLVGKTMSVYSYEVQKKKKAGGHSGQRKASIDIVHSYCPFCGEKYPEPKDKKEVAHGTE